MDSKQQSLKAKNAELQKELALKNRELEVEAALERVRTVAMGMLKPGDLSAICETMFREFQKLGFDDLRNAMIDIHYEEQRYLLNYDYSENSGRTVTRFVYNSHPIVDNLINHARHSTEVFTEMVYGGEALAEWRDFRKKNGEADDTRLDDKDALYYYFYSIGAGAVGISTYSAANPEQLDILKRFRNVFDLAYKRYVDITNAIAQAMEAKIEAALERVRSRSMGMQKSDELKEVIQVIYDQFVHLDIAIEHTGFVVDYMPGGDWHFWIADQLGSPAKLTIADYDCAWNNSFDEAKEKGIDFFTTQLNFEDKNKFYRDLFARAPGIPDQEKELIFSKPGLAGSTVLMEDVALYIENFEGTPYTDEENATLMRFGKVFQQTYTRFLDLQKAEAQTREAQIEAALERVRSRAMAMHKTDELLDAAELLYRELTNLGIESMAVTYSLMDDAEKNAFYYSINPVDGKINPKFFELPHNETDVMRSILASWKKKETVNMIALDEESTIKLQTLLAGSNINMTFSVEAFLAASPKKAVIYTFNFAQGYIFIIGAAQLAKEQEEMVLRFTKVFELTYRRFLDIKQAEEQARESQIQLALERVRARTIAMQHSDELREVVVTVYEQLQQLNFDSHACNIITVDKASGNMQYWVSGFSQEIYPLSYQVPHLDHPYYAALLDPWRNGDKYTVITYSGEMKKSFDALFFTQTDFRRVPDEPKKMMIGFESITLSTAFVGDVSLQALGPEALSDENASTLQRFTVVFEQTYTRFLDLQKAEAQAREAEIQLALERVRARTMAMYKGEELADTAILLFDQLAALGIKQRSCGFLIMNEQSETMADWSANLDADGKATIVTGTLSFDQHPILAGVVQTWKKGEPYFIGEVHGDELQQYYGDVTSKESASDDIKQKVLAVATSEYTNSFYFQFGMMYVLTPEPLTDHQINIMLRFAAVFKLTYTRFLDLQKAEAQAREGQIQLALERVRARTMAMQHSEELPEAANLLFQQVQSLGMPAWSAGYCTWDDDKRAITLWMSSEGVLQPPFKAPTTQDPSFIQWREAQERGEKFFVEEIGGDELIRHYEYMRTLPVVGEILDSIIAAGHLLPTFQINHCAYFSQGFLLFITYQPVPGSWYIFQRFAAVFEQTYTRFLDLQKAEAQAREGQIQLALERVRARTMAMQHSDELSQTVFILFQQFKDLGENPDQATIGIINEDDWVIEYWVTMYGGQDNRVFKFSIDEPDVTRKIYDAWKEQKKSLVIDLMGKSLKDFSTYRALKGGAAYNKAEKQRIINVAFFSKGLINVQSTVARSEESLKLLERFAAVFDGTYTRFLDLKQAEAQAREAQIELALERVRARTMAMQHSDELSETAFLLSEQFRQFGESTKQTTIGIIDEEQGLVDFSATDIEGNKTAQTAKASINEPSLMIKLYTAWKEKKKSVVIGLSGDELAAWVKYRSRLMELADDTGAVEGTRYVHVGFFSKGLISLSTDEPVSPEVIRLLERFAAVFDGTYTRFLDLKKAEAQAREAQIELGLERVRARAMAMQNSDELAELVATVLGELKKLDFALSWCLITIVDYEAWACRVWMANAHVDQLPQSYYLPFTDLPFQKAIMQAWKERKTKWVYELKGNDKKATDEYMFAKTDYRKLPEAAQASIRALDPAFFSFTFSNFGGLQTGGAQPLSEANLDILSRFGKVFDNTYTRFNDLQKAEAQARESQIQLALERVRARTMAMQHSSELADASFVLDSQVRSLGIETRGCAFNIYGDNESTEWFGSEGGSLPVYKTPRENIFLTYYQAGQKGESLLIKEHDVEACAAHYEYLCTLPGVGESLRRMKEAGGSFPVRQIDHVAYFKYGYLLFITLAPAPQAHDIFKRFAKVFEQTYTRFLDLQKVEAQAREAQIEAALERVRSRSIGMQKSDELKEVIQIIYEQFVHLNIDIEHTGFVVDYEPGGDWHFWIADQLGVPNKLKVANYDCEWNNSFDNAREKGIDFFAINLDFDEKNKFYNDLFSHADEVPEEAKAVYLSKPGLAVSTVLMEDVALYIENFEGTSYTDEENATLMRFGKVFQQTYTRFLDLQKAEAQAREAQIQLGLERVRARAMAMQTSEELNTLVGTLFEELTKLDFVLTRCLIMIFDPETLGSRWCMANSETPAEPMNFLVQNHDNPAYLAYLKAWRELVSTWQYELKGKVKRDWDDFLFVDTGLSHLPAPVIDGMKAPETVLLSASFNNFGCLTLVSLVPMSAEHSDIMLRFAKAFDMSYTRFNDLKQAEGQAREAKIELSLERVRNKTMAMYNSKDVGDTVATMFDELVKLGVEKSVRCGVGIIDHTKYMELWTATNQDSNFGLIIGRVDMTIHPMLEQSYTAWKNKESFFSYLLEGSDRESYFRALIASPEYHTPYTLETIPERQINSVFFFPEGCLFAFTTEPMSAEVMQLFKRFTVVFGLTYRRYVDLQKAEAQAREAQIEAALEKVRSRSLGMHRSEEIKDVVITVMEKVNELNIEMNGGVSLATFIEDSQDLLHWYVNPDHVDGAVTMRLPYFNNVLFDDFIEARKSGKEILPVVYSFDKKNSYFKYAFEHSDFKIVPDDLKQWIFEQPYFGYSVAIQNHCAIFFNDYTGRLFSEKENDVLIRFAKVFEQAYVRFLDLKKAEAQAREAQIENALEKVRSRSLAMHKSDELKDVVTIVFDKLTELGLPFDSAVIGEFIEGSKDVIQWAATPGHTYARSILVPHADNTFWSDIWEQWDSGKDFFAKVYAYEEKNAIWKWAFENAEFKEIMPEDRKAWILASPSFAHSTAISKNSTIGVSSYSGHLPSEQDIDILKRLGRVFEQAYVRFLDLKKSEAQAWEAKVENALEKVRSRTMAMQHSEELADTSVVLFQQLIGLGIEPNRLFIGIIKDDSGDIELWATEEDGSKLSTRFTGNIHRNGSIHKMYEGWKAQKKSITIDMTGKVLKDYFNYLQKELKVPFKLGLSQKRRVQHMAYFAHGFIGMASPDEQPAETTRLMERFAGVFNLTYTRFNDLQKAEAQAHEARMEAALEKVRGKAMAMHRSSDLNMAVLTVFEELEKLDLEIIRCGIGIIDRENRVGDIWTTVKMGEELLIQVSGKEPFNIHPLLQGTFDAWLAQRDFSYVLQGEDMAAYYKAVATTNFNLPESHSILMETEGLKQYYYTPTFQTGNLYAFKDVPFHEDGKKIMQRFAAVLNLTFNRFFDLQKAEAQARDAVKQASVDRVRAEIASMRTTNDLDRITPLIWNELTILSIPFIRCGVFIINEHEQLIHTYLSTPDGKALAAFDLQFDSGGISQNVLPAWRNNQVATIHWSEEEFAAFTKNLVEQGTVKSQERYVTEHPDTSLDLHFLPFLQGMLYVGNTAPLSTEDMDLAQSLASAFSTAYARYEDFNRLELAKVQVENTLTELRSAQTQLVQREKMASLGELTAGIAHEIQNPLNFVNNFSEVNQEMIDELEVELKSGNIADALAIAADIKQNEEKINHHGKRADSIVKGMLEHSRTGGGDKLPTNMNVLADEFLRLSYHGLRAKDKNFNAEMVTHFDETLPKISIIQQDMGRVLLNLFNNAFYAVNQKKKTGELGYKPEVAVATSVEKNSLIVRVKDNGNGIPDAIKDKIMQPFFTTKPTGEGTGLGLSLSYDIVVKGHEGTIKVETKEGQYTEFIITLPLI